MWDGEVVSRQAHILKVTGSNPVPATIIYTMKNILKLEFPLHIYPISIDISIGSNLKELYKGYTSSTGTEITEFADVADLLAFTHVVKNKVSKKLKVLIYFINEEEVSFCNVAHESTHAAKAVFDYIGADIEDEEAFAYLVGYIAECCEKALKRYKKSASIIGT